MARGKDQRYVGYAIVAGLLALLYYLLQKGGSFLHESVSSSILSSSGTVLPNALGIAQYDPRVPASVPPGAANPLIPLAADGTQTWNPADPTKATCPAGYLLWYNNQDGTYQCLPS